MRVANSYVGYEYDETKAYEKNGKMYVSARCKCDRCNGSGIAISHVCNGQPVPYVNDGGICYSCNGAGYFRKEIRLYTDKEFEQMEKASIKAAEKREAAKEQKMKAVRETSFALLDAGMYLDTHPCDERALMLCRKMVKERKELLEKYAQNFGPLTIDCTDMSESENWKWMEQPFPWEREGGCR